MRKYMQPVFDAFLAKKARKAPAILGHDGERHVTLWTDGKTLYSYAMPIARHVNGWLYLVSTEQSPSRTTTAQMRCLRERIPSDVPVQFVDAEWAAKAAAEARKRGGRGAAAMKRIEKTSIGCKGDWSGKGEACGACCVARSEHWACPIRDAKLYDGGEWFRLALELQSLTHADLNAIFHFALRCRNEKIKTAVREEFDRRIRLGDDVVTLY